MTEKNKWADIEGELARQENATLGEQVTSLEVAQYAQKQLQNEILLRIAKSLDHLDNYGIITGSA